MFTNLYIFMRTWFLNCLGRVNKSFLLFFFLIYVLVSAFCFLLFRHIFFILTHPFIFIDYFIYLYLCYVFANLYIHKLTWFLNCLGRVNNSFLLLFFLICVLVSAFCLLVFPAFFTLHIPLFVLIIYLFVFISRACWSIYS